MKQRQMPEDRKNGSEKKQDPKGAMADIMEPERCQKTRPGMGAKEALRILARHYNNLELERRMVSHLDDSPFRHEPMSPDEVKEFFDAPKMSEKKVLAAINACDRNCPSVRSLLANLAKSEDSESICEAAKATLEDGNGQEKEPDKNPVVEFYKYGSREGGPTVSAQSLKNTTTRILERFLDPSESSPPTDALLHAIFYADRTDPKVVKLLDGIAERSKR